MLLSSSSSVSHSLDALLAVFLLNIVFPAYYETLVSSSILKLVYLINICLSID